MLLKEIMTPNSDAKKLKRDINFVTDKSVVGAKDILTQEYEMESHRLSLMTCNRCFSIYLLKFI